MRSKSVHIPSIDAGELPEEGICGMVNATKTKIKMYCKIKNFCIRLILFQSQREDLWLPTFPIRIQDTPVHLGLEANLLTVLEAVFTG